MRTARRRWRLRPPMPLDFLAGSAYPPLIRQLLYNRGVRGVKDSARYLFQESLEAVQASWELPGLSEAVARLAQALREDETIAVYGDFDVDGITATALLTQGLTSLGARVIPYIPHRVSEGYGLNNEALTSLWQRGAEVLVAADCGISSVAEVAHARSLGLDVVILDHHSLPPVLPTANAIVNPKMTDASHPCHELSSVGVAYVLIASLHDRLGRYCDPVDYLDLVALGTVADVAPLTGANRHLVRAGLTAIASGHRPGLMALIEAAGIGSDRADTEAIGYSIAPRLNAAGRLDHAGLSLRLLLCQDTDEVRALALHLNDLNQQRQRLTAQAMELAKELLEADDSATHLAFVGHPDIPQGIVGVVAGRLAEELYRPVVVYERGEVESRGSARTIPELDIIAAFRASGHLMKRYGGHRGAAGFTVDNENLTALKDALQQHAAWALAGVDLVPALDIDAEVRLSQLRGREIGSLRQLAPFGEGNPEPTFLSRRIQLVDVRSIGNNGSHLRLKLRDGAVTWPAVGFHLGSDLELTPGMIVDIVYTLAVDRRSGAEALELRILDLIASQK